MFDSGIVCCYLHPITKYGYPPPVENTFKYIDEMASLGFASIELEGIREERIDFIHKNCPAVKKKIAERKVAVPYYCAVLPGLTSADEKIRERSLELFEKGCETAAVLGSAGILDNAPLAPYIFPDDIPVLRHHDEDSLREAFFPPDFSWGKFMDRMIDTFRTLCDTAAKYNLTYQLHPAVGFLFSTTDGFLYFSDKVNRDNLRFNFDTANLFAVKENLPLALLRLKDSIDYIHFSDNGGTRVEHLAAGKGSIPWEEFFETLDKIGFRGHIGVDIGGDESGVGDIDKAYRDAAEFLQTKWLRK